MKIVDFETNRALNDVALYLSKEEVEELVAYLQKLQTAPDLHHVFLSNVAGITIERELTVAISA